MEMTDKCRALLLSKETQEKYGYTIESLGNGSGKCIIHKCDVCGLPKETPFSSFVKEKNLSHHKCSYVKKRQTFLKNYGVDNPRKAKKIKERIKQTIKDRFGVENASQSILIKEKKRQTTQKHYGVNNPYQSPEIKEKLRQIHQERYGVDNPSEAPEVQEKRKRTCIERFGVEYAASAPDRQAKARQTCLERFGVETPFESLKVLQKTKDTIFSKYGVEHIAHIPGIVEQRRQTCLEVYGVESPSQLPKNRNRLKEWCIQNPDKCFTPKSEVEILEWTRIYYPEAKKYKDGTFEIDVFIPSINVGIEHNGLFWHAEEVVGKSYHLNKTEYFRDKNIRIIHIFEHEWKFRQEQVKSFLLSALGKNQYRVGMRECEVIWSSKAEDIKETHNFLEQYHIQGAPSNTKHIIKVVYEDRLIGVATFGKHHRNNKDWVLTRFCTKTNYTIQGALSKISKLASQQLKGDILSWADFRLSNGNGYERAGWKFEKLLPPDYFYHVGDCKVVSKQSRQKRIVKTPKGMTEGEHAILDGLHRVYDCGKIRYRFEYVG